MDKRTVLGAVALLAAVDVGLWFAVFQRSTPPVTGSSGSEAGETSPVATASPEPSASTASAAPPSERPSARPSERPSARPSDDPTAGSPSPESPSLESPSEGSPSAEPPDDQPGVELTTGPVTAAAYETVPISGVLNGAQEATTLRVQYQQGGRWTSFPLPTITDAQGRFTTYVELGAPGTYPLRVLDPRTGATSPEIVLTIT